MATPSVDTPARRGQTARPHGGTAAGRAGPRPGAAALRALGRRPSAATGPFGRLWLAHALSNLGDGVTIAAAPLLAASLTEDPRLVAGLGTAATLPWLLTTPVVGALVDRVDRRRLMATADLARCGLMVALVAALAADHVGLALLYAVFFALGCGEVVFDTAAEAYLPAVVEADRLDRANGRMETVEVVGNELVGPGVGGALFAGARAVPFVADAVSFALSAALVLSLRGVAPERPATRPAPGGVLAGARWLWRQPTLRTFSLVAVAGNLVAGATVFGVSVLFARQELGLGAAGYGALLAVSGLGGVAGGLVAAPVSARLGRDGTAVAAVGASAVAAAGTALSGDVAVVAALFALGSLAVGVWRVVATSLRQTLVPDDLRGRVAAVYAGLATGALPVGALAGGFVAEAAGLRAVYWSSAGLLAVCLAGLGRRLRGDATRGA